jgi:hypothetical protein
MSPGVAAQSRVASPETRAYLASDRTGVRPEPGIGTRYVLPPTVTGA